MIVGQTQLNGLKINAEPAKTLTPPEQLLTHQVELTTAPATNNTVENKVETTKSELSTSDNFSSKINLASSGLAGGIAAAKIAQNVGIIGESIRAPQVQMAMNEMTSKMMNNQGGFFSSNSYNSNYNNNYNNNGYNNNNYNNSYNNYNNDYSATEYVRRRTYGGIESLDGNYSGNGTRSPEMTMAIKNIASGAFQGAKYGTLIGGAVSAIVNAYNVVTGKSTGKDAVGSVAADTVTAGLSGAGGAVAGGFASLGLGMIGIGGVPGLALATCVGVAGAVGTQFLFQKSGIYDALKEKVISMLSKK